VNALFLFGWLMLTPFSLLAPQEPSPNTQIISESESGRVSQDLANALQAQNVETLTEESDAYVPTSVPTSPTYDALTARQKFSVFGRRMISPTGFAKSAFTASVSDSPEEWGQGMGGFAKRYGNKIATRTVENGIGFLVSVPLRQDPRYFQPTETGLWERVRHALIYTVLTPTDNGGRTFATWRFAGNYGAQFVSNSWRPERYRTVSDTLRRGTVSVGYDAAANVFRAIWPDVKRKFLKH
jgi:hypothetical protein